MPSSKGCSQPGIEPTSFMSPVLAGGFFTTRATQEAQLKVLGPLKPFLAACSPCNLPMELQL